MATYLNWLKKIVKHITDLTNSNENQTIKKVHLEILHLKPYFKKSFLHSIGSSKAEHYQHQKDFSKEPAVSRGIWWYKVESTIN